MIFLEKKSIAQINGEISSEEDREKQSLSFTYHINFRHWYIRSSHQGCSVKKIFLKILQNSREKHLCQRLFFNKVAGLRPPTILRKNLCHRCFPVNFAKFLRTALFKEHLWWLLLVHFTFLIKKHLPNKVYYFAHAWEN